MAIAADRALSAPGDAHDGALSLLVVLAVVATAFNDLYPVLPIGELSKEGFVYVLPALAGYLLLFRFNSIEIPTNLLVFALMILVIVAAGVQANYEEISSAFFKGRSGMGRVVTQGFSLGFGLVVALIFYNITLQGFFDQIARGAFAALAVMAGVGAFELASWFSIPALTQVHDALSLLIHESGDYVSRLRMTAFEVSWASVALTFLFPFAVANRFLRGWALGAVMTVVTLLVVLAQSRTAILVSGFQVLLLTAYYLWRRLDIAVHLAAALSLAVLVAVSLGSVGERLAIVAGNVVEYGSFSGSTSGAEENVSNVTRLAAIRAGLEMFHERPLLGVGIGQYGFNYPGHIHAADMRSWEVQTYIRSGDELWPPSYSLHARLLAELGVLGYAVWLVTVLVVLARCFLRSDSRTSHGRACLAVALTLTGWILLGISIDTFRFFGGWIALGTGLALCRMSVPSSAGLGAPAQQPDVAPPIRPSGMVDPA